MLVFFPYIIYIYIYMLLFVFWCRLFERVASGGEGGYRLV